MKGLNCYASFWDDPGIEKLLDFLKVKSSFLMPVTPSHYRGAPFFRSQAAGVLSREFISVSSSTPATTPVIALHIFHGGSARLKVAPGRVLLRANRFKETT